MEGWHSGPHSPGDGVEDGVTGEQLQAVSCTGCCCSTPAKGMVEHTGKQHVEEHRFVWATKLPCTVLDTLVKTRRTYSTKMKPNVNSGLRVIMLCPCGFVTNKRATLATAVDNGGDCGVRVRAYTGTLYFLLSFAINLKLALNK